MPGEAVVWGSAGATLQVPGGVRRRGGHVPRGLLELELRGFLPPEELGPVAGGSGGDSEQRALGPVATLGRWFLSTYYVPGDTQMKVNRQKHTSYLSPTT